jgi:dipeptidyl aminopeptidase/acylaminoacyl peptidase
MKTVPLAPPLIPREVLFGGDEKELPRISPDGSMLAYVAPCDGTSSVWVRNLAEDSDRVVAHDAGKPILWFTWQGNGKSILYFQDQSGNERYHLFQLDLQSGSVRDLTPGDGVRAQPLRGFLASVAAVNHRYPDEMLICSNARDEKLNDAVRVDLARGELILDTENPGDVSGWLNDNAYVVRAALAQRTDGSSEIRVRDDAAAPWRVLDTFSFEDGTPSMIAFSEDNASLYVITSKGWNASRLVRYDVATGVATPMLEDPSYDVGRVYIDPSTQRLVAGAVLRERCEWHVLDDGFAEVFPALAALHAGDVRIENATADGNTLLVQYLNDTTPTAFFTYDRRERRSRMLFYSRPELLQYTLAPMQPFAFEARDGLTIHGYLTLPPGREPKDLPTVMYVHGGPWYRDRWGYEPLVQWMANRGYAVVQVNFRGSIGYGKAFLNAANRQWAGTMRTDLLDARDWAIVQGFADAKRFAIFGGSYGGYAVLTALTFTPDAFTCGVDIVGPSNLNTMLAAMPPYWTAMRSTVTQRMGEDPAFLESQSPLFKADQIRVPLLVVHGANDPRVKLQESDRIVEMARKNDVPVTYVVFENEGHGFAHPANLKRFAALAESFLGEHLGGVVEPAHADEAIEAYLR